MNRMCIDPEQYQPDEYWRSIGIDSLEQVRHEMLWRAAEDRVRPIHTGQCKSCLALYESFVQLRAIAVPANPAAEVAVACCPNAATLAAYQTGEMKGFDFEAIHDHLKTCPPCREDLAFLARSLEPRERLLSTKGRSILMAIAAAALIAAIIPWHRAKTKEVNLDPNFKVSQRYASLAQMPPLNRAEMLKESPEPHRSRLSQVLDAYQKGDYANAEKFAGIMTDVVQDSSAEYILAMARLKQNKLKEGYEAMLTSERIAPQSPPRCWATLQYALLVGDKKTVEREANHIGDEDAYANKCKTILAKIT